MTMFKIVNNFPFIHGNMEKHSPQSITVETYLVAVTVETGLFLLKLVSTFIEGIKDVTEALQH